MGEEKEWGVDVYFNSVVCLRVKARSAEEAEGKVDDLLEKDPKEVLTQAQKDDVISGIFENIAETGDAFEIGGNY